MNSVQKEYAIGFAFALLALFFIFVVTPAGVPVPNASVVEEGSVSPRFFPLMTWWGVFLFGILQIVETYIDVKTGYAIVQPAEPVDKWGMFVRLLAITTVALFYWVAEPLGIIITGFVFYVLYAFYCGERNWLRAVIGAVICTLVLYYFFVYVAMVPMPTGLLSFA
ncbi:MAG: tripartite tricarboxylate transporter TctB family protein [Mailhella sp.]|nr:tripartite tricarboxylate transporter TctB family protein [Mailhella sp.]